MSPPAPPPPPPPPPPELTRQRLIRAALELFTTRGYHETTTARIAKKTGVAEGTIYRHFASKQQLVNELYRAAQRWAVKVVQESAEREEASDTRARLAAAATGLLEGAARDPAIVKLGLLEPVAGVLDEESRRAARDVQVAIERLIADGKARGAVRAGAVEVWAGVWLAAIAHAAAKVVAGQWTPGDNSVRLVIEGAWRSIAASSHVD